jgi:hypothetical protein
MFPFSHLLVFTVTLFSQELGVLNTLMQYSGFDLIRTIFNSRKPFEFQGHITLQCLYSSLSKYECKTDPHNELHL